MSQSTNLPLEDEISAIGRTRTMVQTLDASSMSRFDAAVGSTVSSPVVHWAFFHEVVGDADLDGDGHPRRGAFMPAIEALPRRMFAGSTISFHAALTVGDEAEMTLRIADVRRKQGRSGDVVFVDVERRIVQDDVLRITEIQTIVYQAAAREKTVAVTSRAVAPLNLSAGEIWTPGCVNLFRFSAATFNGHRIHYDSVFATEVEGYPGLVVQGPFIAARLAELAGRDGALRTFEFRASAPCFVDRPISFRSSAPGVIQAVRDDGTVSMTAKAIYR